MTFRHWLYIEWMNQFIPVQSVMYPTPRDIASVDHCVSKPLTISRHSPRAIIPGNANLLIHSTRALSNHLAFLEYC